MNPISQAPKEPSDEERRWRAAAEDPARVKRHLKILYICFGAGCALTIGWIIAAICGVLSMGWATAIMLASGLLNIGIGIVNNRRILAGEKPW